MSRQRPTRAEMLEELCAILELLRGYRVEVLLQPVGQAHRVELTMPARPAAAPAPANATPPTTGRWGETLAGAAKRRGRCDRTRTRS